MKQDATLRNCLRSMLDRAQDKEIKTLLYCAWLHHRDFYPGGVYNFKSIKQPSQYKLSDLIAIIYGNGHILYKTQHLRVVKTYKQRDHTDKYATYHLSTIHPVIEVQESIPTGPGLSDGWRVIEYWEQLWHKDELRPLRMESFLVRSGSFDWYRIKERGAELKSSHTNITLLNFIDSDSNMRLLNTRDDYLQLFTIKSFEEAYNGKW